MSMTRASASTLAAAIFVICLVPQLNAPGQADAAIPDRRQAKPTRLTTQFMMRVQVREQGSWDTQTISACSDRTSSGTQIIVSDSAKTGNGQKPYLWTFVQQRNSRAIYGFYEAPGKPLDAKQEVTITVEAKEQTIDKPCDEPVNECPECEYTPLPQLVCGERPGTLTLTPPFVEAVSDPGFLLSHLYSGEPSTDPFYDESGKTFCPNGALSQWPQLLALEKEWNTKIPLRKGLRYFSLSPKDQATCQRWAKFGVDKCKANFTVKVKELKTVNTPLPEYEVSRYESVVTYSFWFSGVCSTQNGVQTCFDRLPTRWKRVGKLPGDPGY